MVGRSGYIEGMKISIALLTPALLAGMLLLPMSGAMAAPATGGTQTVGGYGPRTLPSPDKPKSEGPAPGAVPGSHANDSPVADPSKPIADMNPNEQLFDAINRGDVAVAQEAIKHGADLSARNVLGMTPLELSVDLDRDKITFMLIALQGTDGGHRAAVAKAGKGVTPRVSAKVSSPYPVAAPVQAHAPRAASAPAAAPVRQYANDTGTPNPQAGFLGFGAH